mmetsp:Transcript_33348/g.51081  ORF Transcript_33348/g.51081 Transcript_33348/m.51081 type:complete len:108 (-) Transcript_33348:959-1282(-)
MPRLSTSTTPCLSQKMLCSLNTSGLRPQDSSCCKGRKSVDSLPKWNFDGSSTDQAPGDDSEVILRLCRIFKDPFRPRSEGPANILVICDTYTPAGEPLPSNTRAVGT